MPTRRQDSDEKRFRQDAFASSAENDRGMLGNLVAARCHKLTDAEEIAMIWWLQQVSWRDGGLDKFAADFLAFNRASIGTRSMHKFGMKSGQVYNAEQVMVVREEMMTYADFPLRGESRDDGFLGLREKSWEEEEASRAESAKFPICYPVADFIQACTPGDQQFVEFLKRATVDPASPSLRDSLWYFTSVWDALCACRQREINAANGGIVETDIVRTVSDELDFALQSRSFILIEGREGIGKTESTNAWCAQHPGQAVYCRLESGNDEASFFRSIARAIGTACSYGHTAAQMRARIQDTLQPGYIMLVLDEAHFLWPTNERTARCTPRRIEWLRTALVDFGVPVAMVSTPQFFTRQCDRFRKIGWNANQVQRRLAHTVTLPEVLSPEDTLSVARRCFPKASARDLKRIAGTALISLGFLSTIINVRKRVDYMSAKQPGRTESEYIETALAAYKTPAASPLPPAGKGPAGRLQGHGKAEALTIPSRSNAPANFSSVNREQPALTMT